jgi:hypothetical protein
MITAKDIVQSRAWSDMIQALEANLHDQFRLVEPTNVQNLILLRLRWDALHSVRAAFELQANEVTDGR